jgi:homoserine O-succinyltransferase
MPDEARRRTEQQFCVILARAARIEAIGLRYYTLDSASLVELDEAWEEPRYNDLAMLEAAPPDGLIVTGMPPRAAALADEPFWNALTELIDLALDRAIPTVWSCMAAHAAVLYLDGIERRRLPEKLSGLVECTRVAPLHPIADGLPRRWECPHSRYNEVPEDELRASGYRIISHSSEAGADIFVKDVGSLFLFCQGHPEYDADTLLREYRRDIRQFLAGKRDAYPPMPSRTFGSHATELLDQFRARALRMRTVDILADFPMGACAAELGYGWRDVAVGLYANWLAHVARGRALRRDRPTTTPYSVSVSDSRS